ncbi:hypothetical protein MMC09_007044 [Bachmanniomyces sp. S44760]|nr:hypothetical protein [Bachmanniomyces sp. S44760]
MLYSRLPSLDTSQSQHRYRGDGNQSSNTITLAASQDTTPPLPNCPYPGPYSASILDERVADFKASLQQSVFDLKFKAGSEQWKGDVKDRAGNLSIEPCLQSHMSQWPSTGSRSDLTQDVYRRQNSQLPPLNEPPGLVPTRDSPSTTSTSKLTVDSAHTPESESASVSSEQKQLRLLPMQNILNPTGAIDRQSNQRSSSDESPSNSTPRFSPGASQYGHETSRLPPIVSQVPEHTYDRKSSVPGRPSILAPISGTIGLPAATIDARASPFLPPGGQSYSQGSGGPPHAEGTAGSASSALANNLPAPNATHALERGFVATVNAPPSSRRGSPSNSYSSFSQMSPSMHYAMAQQQGGQYYQNDGMSLGRGSTSQQRSLGSEGSYSPTPSSMSQGAYQLMTLDTDQGPIQVPVDVQAASKMADEKRKRNAGASARFRERRKQKEREASQTIAKLEHQNRETIEEKEYYRQERDYFRGLVYGSSVQSQVGPRPPSPRTRKVPQGGVTNGAMVDAQWDGPEARDPDGRNTRRKTSAYPAPYDLPRPTYPVASRSPRAASVHFSHPNRDMRAPTLSTRPSLPQLPRGGPYDPSVPPTYDRAWRADR